MQFFTISIALAIAASVLFRSPFGRCSDTSFQTIGAFLIGQSIKCSVNCSRSNKIHMEAAKLDSTIKRQYKMITRYVARCMFA